MDNLQTKLEKLEQAAKTYCVGKVEGEVKSKIVGAGDYYAYAQGVSYLANSIEEAVDLALQNLNANVA